MNKTKLELTWIGKENRPSKRRALSQTTVLVSTVRNEEPEEAIKQGNQLRA
ncbi:MAG: hypothetical protein IT366_16260 [Candidatus Hydrogenedentes bacterium]|nr:hypothetical protein [Candidatus Hydrogenedentota bacterium]